jgi:hypothetical protein
MIEIISELGRLPKAEEDAINLMLLKYGGQFQGAAYYRMGWAPDDNASLAKIHICGRTDPFDLWSCNCLNVHSNKLPVCYHPIQNSYHLKSWEPPTPGDEELLKLHPHVEEDLSRGSYRCLFHLVDRDTQKPLQLPILKELIVEGILPILKVGSEGQKAIAHGDHLRRRELHRQRAQRQHDKDERTAKSYDSLAESLLKDSIPAFGGQPFAGGGVKHRQSAELDASDIARGEIIIED